MQSRKFVFLMTAIIVTVLADAHAQQSQKFSVPFKGGKIVSIDTFIVKTREQVAAAKDSAEKPKQKFWF